MTERQEARRAATGMGIATAASRSIGFVRVLVVAAILGTTYLGNAYQSSNSVSNVLFELIAAGALSAVLVPTFEGKMLDFGGATVIFLITVGFLLAGIVGAILALPVAMASRDIYGQYFRKSIHDSEILATPVVAPVPVSPQGLVPEGA